MTYIIRLSLFCLLLFSGTVFSKNKIFLVPPFENISNVKSISSYDTETNSFPYATRQNYTIDRYTEIPRAILEDIIINSGAEVVERQKLDQLLKESEFARLSGLVKTEDAVKLGKMLGANTVILGTIIDVHSVSSNFNGYGINSNITKVLCSIRIRIMDIESGRNKFSKIVKGESTYSSSQFGGVSNNDVAYSLIESTLNELNTDNYFLQSLK